MARETGELIDWKDDRGFGFIRRPENAGDLFVHIKSIRATSQRPKLGDRLTYAIGPGKDGRPVAVDVSILGARKPVEQAPRVYAAVILIALLTTGIVLGRLPVWVSLLYGLAGVGSFLYYGADKVAANRKGWRTPERKLHIVDAAFGVIGGLLGQHVFHHKIWKSRFVIITSIIAAAHALVLGLIVVGVFEH